MTENINKIFGLKYFHLLQDLMKYFWFNYFHIFLYCQGKYWHKHDVVAIRYWMRIKIAKFRWYLIETYISYTTRMEIFGYNNLVSYKAATRLNIPWICNVFYCIATLLNGCNLVKWLQTPCNKLKIICVYVKIIWLLHSSSCWYPYLGISMCQSHC